MYKKNAGAPAGAPAGADIHTYAYIFQKTIAENMHI